MAPTTYSIELAPSLENPHQYAEYWLRLHEYLSADREIPPGASLSTEHQPEGRGEWRIRCDRGWFSGFVVRIVPEKDSPERATIHVDWDSVASRGLVTSTVAAGCLAALATFALAFLIVVIVMGIGNTLLALALARIFGCPFTDEWRSRLAARLQTVPVPQPD